jgi:hypothetical protein
MYKSVSWRKSSYSPDWDDCVEVAPLGGKVGIRDGKDTSAPALEVHP